MVERTGLEPVFPDFQSGYFPKAAPLFGDTDGIRTRAGVPIHPIRLAGGRLRPLGNRVFLLGRARHLANGSVRPTSFYL